MSAFDQAWNVGDDEAVVVDHHRAELGLEGGEGVIRDLRLGSGDGGKKGGFAGIGQTDQAGVRKQLEPKPDPALLALLAGLGEAGRLVGRGLEARIALTTASAFHQDDRSVRLFKIGQQGLTIFGKDLRPLWQVEKNIRAGRAGPVAAHAVGAAFGFEMLLVAKVDQGVQAFVDARDHATAVAAVAAIGAAAGNVFFTTEADAASTAVAGFDVDLGLIEETHFF